jgi:ubiquinone/menaquinone biosynthesis C-methylase UbiE
MGARQSGSSEKESRREHWETLWQEKKKNVEQVYSNEDRILRQLLHVCDLKDKRVLEVGAGTGRDSFPLIEYGAKVVQLDYSVNSLQILRSLSEELHVQTNIVGGDTFQLPFRDETFDVVFHQGLLEHFRHPQALALLQENIRVLKRGGYLLVDVPQRYHLYTVVKHILIAINQWFAGWERSFSTPELTTLLQSSGLSTVHAYGEWMYPSFFYRAFRSAVKKIGVTLPKIPHPVKSLATLRKNIRHSMLDTALPLYTGISIGVIGQKQQRAGA